MTIFELPLVWAANARAMASPIPEVPPMKMATGAGEARWLKAAFVIRMDESEGITVLSEMPASSNSRITRRDSGDPKVVYDGKKNVFSPRELPLGESGSRKVILL